MWTKLAATAASVALVTSYPSMASASDDQPSGLPQNATDDHRKWAPAFDYDGDACFPAPAIGADGKTSPGLRSWPASFTGGCREKDDDLLQANTYARTLCDKVSNVCAHMYALYAEKDVWAHVPNTFNHRHDWEDVVVWTRNGKATHVSTSAHGSYDKHPVSKVQWHGSTHPKIVYHRDDLVRNRAFRLAKRGEDPENPTDAWHYPPVVSWGRMSSVVKNGLNNKDWGKPTLKLKGGRAAFDSYLQKAKPDGVQFDPVWIGFTAASHYGCQSWIGRPGGGRQQLHVKCAGTGKFVKVKAECLSGTHTSRWRWEYNHADCPRGDLDAGYFRLG